MAIWQFDLVFVPRDAPMPWRVEDGHEVTPLEQVTAARCDAWLRVRLGEPHVMVEDWFVFGEDEGSRFDLLRDDEGRAELSVRVDLRSPPDAVIATICELADVAGCVLFSIEHWCVIEPTREELAAAAARSRAARFVRDPLGVLNDAANHGAEPVK